MFHKQRLGCNQSVVVCFIITYVCARDHMKKFHIYCDEVNVHCHIYYITVLLYSQWSYVVPYAISLFCFTVTGFML